MTTASEDQFHLPFGKQFSPAQVNLKKLVQLIITNSGDRAALEAAIAEAFHSSKGDPRKLAMNTFLAAQDYGLLAGYQVYSPTQLAMELDPLDAEQAHLRFARHILTDLHGLTVIQVVRARSAQGWPLTRQAIADDLNALMLDPGGERGEQLSAFRQWLEIAGILNRSWVIREAAIEEALGPSMAELDALLGMTLEHRAFLRALASMPGEPPFDSQDVAQTADLQSGTRLRVLRNLPTRIIDPLEAAPGWITKKKTTAGRGAKAYEVSPTEKFKSDISEPLADALVEQTQLGDPASLRRPLAELLADVRDDSISGHVRGHALEGVSIRLIRLLGARFRAWRRRAPDTSYAEVDVIAELWTLTFQIIQLQSKVSAIASREIIDREVGIAGRLRSNILLFVSAGKIGPGPRRAANEHMADTNLAILCFDGDDLDALATGKRTVTKLVEREFRQVRAVKP